MAALQEVFADFAATTLASAVTTTPSAGTSETWTLTSNALPLPQVVSGATFTRITVGPSTDTSPEIVWLIATLSSNQVTVLRGMDGSTIKTHASGAPFTQVVDKGYLNTVAAGQFRLYTVTDPQYGADPTGTNDSTTAIQAAVTACLGAGGGVVWLPAGTYIVSSSILCGGGSPGALTIAGSGWDTQIKLANGSNAYIFDMGSSGSPQFTPGPVFRDLYLNCNGANQTGVSGGIFARGSCFGLYEHVWFEAPYDAGLRFYQDGLGNYGHHNRIIGCLFQDGYLSSSYGQGLRLEQCDENSIVGCTFQDNGTSTYPSAQVYDHSAGLQSFVSCSWVTTRSTSVTMVKTDSNPSRCSFTSCQFDSSTTGNQLELNGDDCMVTACAFLNFGSGSGTNAAVHMSNNNTVVTACNFVASGTKGIAIAEDASLSGNRVVNNTAIGTYNTVPYVLHNAIPVGGGIFYNVLDYGAKGDGTTDDTAAIQACINACGAVGGGTVIFPYGAAGYYAVSSHIVFQPNITYQGVAYSQGAAGPCIFAANGSNIGAGSVDGLFVPYGWQNNYTVTDSPVRFDNLCFSTNSPHNTGIADCLILMNFESTVENCIFINSCNHGIHITDTTKNGSTISGSSGQHIINHNFFNETTGDGVHQTCSAQSAGLDSFLTDNFFGGTNNGVWLDYSDGWLLRGNHFYGVNGHGIYAGSCYATRILENYIESFGNAATTSATYYGIYAGILDGYGVEIVGNQISCVETNGTSVTYNYVEISGGASSGPFYGVVSNNILTGPFGGGTVGGTGLYLNVGSGSQLFITDDGNIIQEIHTPIKTSGAGMNVDPEKATPFYAQNFR